MATKQEKHIIKWFKVPIPSIQNDINLWGTPMPHRIRQGRRMPFPDQQNPCWQLVVGHMPMNYPMEGKELVQCSTMDKLHIITPESKVWLSRELSSPWCRPSPGMPLHGHFPGAICTDGHPYAWTWCLFWINCDYHGRTPLGVRLGRPFLPITPLQVSLSLPTWMLWSPSRTKGCELVTWDLFKPYQGHDGPGQLISQDLQPQ